MFPERRKLTCSRDASSRHISDADESLQIGSIEESQRNPFLDIELLVQTALSVGADAIHPGYGYLSENADFATRVQEAGMIFIGPGPSAMSTLGDKRAAKDYLRERAQDVPLIPGYSGSTQDATELAQVAAEIGFPVMLKASAGGGGKGMRIIRERAQLQAELQRAQSEAQRSFGSADCILEKYIESSKHVEIQIVGDSHGEVVSFLDRDCSVQRRHQKVIEETPCIFLTPEMREKMSATAVQIAKLIGYENAGTVEFVVDVRTGKFYFLEVNARLQVEHPITEEVTGVDLVSVQLYVAAGGSLAALPDLQNITQQGHAIESRLCAEDPRRNFFPEHGKIILWLPASGPLGPGRDVRYETAVQTGSTVSIFFDSMIAKIVVWAPTRALAIEKMTKVLAHTVCAGVKTNQLLLQKSLAHRVFHNSAYTTGFLPSYLDELLREPVEPDMSDIRKSLSIIPCLVLRRLADATADASNPRSFKNIRRQFRNQGYGSASAHSEIITAVDWPYNVVDESGVSAPIICLWKPQTAGSANTTAEQLHLLPLPGTEPSEDGTSSVSAQYNEISQALRSGKFTSSGSPYNVNLISWTPAEGNTARRESWLTGTAEVSINGSRIRALLAIQTDTLPTSLNCTQTVFCHVPAVGTYVEFKRDTLLSFMGRLRAAVKQNGKEERAVAAPMPCKVLSILKKNGDAVKSGENVMVIESMKMEVTITVSADGMFNSVWKEGDAVEEGKILCSVN